jgi:integrase
MGKLTATAVKAARKPGRYGDGDGLYLEIGRTGGASWIVRVQKNGKRRDIGIGSAKKVLLAAARIKAAEIRSQVEAGIDPVAARRKEAGIPTFRKAAALVHAEHKRNWKNGKHHAQWIKSLETYAFPAIGDMLISEIEGPAVRDLLAQIWLEKPETARRVRQRIGMVLDWGFSKGFRESEAPMRSITKGLPRQPRKEGHHAAMPYSDVPAFVERLHEKDTWGRLALEAAILTAARSGEVRGATWDEVDLEAGLWTVPANRMKAGKVHVVPLCAEAKRVFARAAELRTASAKYIFQGARPDKPMSDMTLMKVLRDMKAGCTAHGFRSSFRDWVSETTNFPSELAEAALAHTIENKVEAAYRRGNLLEKRRAVMNAWGAYCFSANGNFASISSAAT